MSLSAENACMKWYSGSVRRFNAHRFNRILLQQRCLLWLWRYILDLKQSTSTWIQFVCKSTWKHLSHWLAKCYSHIG